jgi:NADH-quinone oxidoreductase subunit N
MTQSAFLPYLPDVALLALGLLILAADLAGEHSRKPFHVAWIGLLAISALLCVCRPEGALPFGGYGATWGGTVWKQIFTWSALGAVLVSRPYFAPGGNARGTLARPGAFFALLILCVQGMFALVSARDLLTFFLGLELATLPLYALAAFQPRDDASAEAGAKYVLMGGFSSALTLFGISFLYGATGRLDFASLSLAAQAGTPALWAGVFFLLGGLGFKLAMAPFHMWAPDVYQGAPTPVMAFLSVGSKAAAVGGAAALFLGPLDFLRPALSGVFALAAVLSMVIGNLGAMRQKDLRRFVAYSSIAQVGYMLVGFLGEPEAARIALQYNLIAYGATSFGLYYIMSVIGRHRPETLASLRGLNAQSPALAALLLMCMFSLAGIPPLAGFLGKFLLFSAAAASGHYVLIAIAVGNAAVSFYYYMQLVKAAYISAPEAGVAPVTTGMGARVAAVGLSALLLVIGLCPALGDWLAGR